MKSPDENQFTSARNPGGKKKAPSDAALANQNQRINIPFNPTAWDQIPCLSQDDRAALAWFHLHALEQGYSSTRIGEILGYERTVAYKIIKGTYQVKSYAPIMAKIREYRATQNFEGSQQPGSLREPDWVTTAASATYDEGLDFASRGGFALLVGRSGLGKTRCAKRWAARNPGRLLRINAPAMGGPAAFIHDLADLIGVTWRKQSCGDVLRRVRRQLASGPGHLLLIDQGTRLLPEKRKMLAQCWEVLMDLNEDGTGIAVALTWRASEAMMELRYQIEQVVSRGEWFAAPQSTEKKPYPTRAEVEAIARQWGPNFSDRTIDILHDVALRPGAFREMVKVLDLAERAARKAAGVPVNDPQAPLVEISDRLIEGAMKNRRKRSCGLQVRAEREIQKS